jgi:hypothetical protein
MLEPYFFVVFHGVFMCAYVLQRLRLDHDIAVATKNIAVAAKIKTYMGDYSFVDLGE